MRNPLRYFLSLIVLSALLYLLDNSSFFETVSSGINREVMGPVTHGGITALSSVGRGVSSLFSLRAIVGDLTQAERERDFFRGEYFRLKEVEKENEFLRQTLNVDDSGESIVLARITASNVLRSGEEVIIDKGAESGIQPGQAVVGYGRTLLGTVSASENGKSSVLLISAHSSRIPAVLSSSGTQVSLKGSPTGVLELELVPREIELSEGELILTSGLSGVLPSGLIIGEVRRVIDDESASFKRATVFPYITANETREVFVLTDSIK